MIVMDIVIGDTYMLLVGLFVTLIITIQKFVTMETFKRQHAEDRLGPGPVGGLGPGLG